MRIVYLITGIIALVLGVIGALLPVVPTLPFLALAAFCFSRSSMRLKLWLYSLPYYGPMIKDWKHYRVMHPWVKWGIVLGMVLFFGGLILFVDTSQAAKIGWAVSGGIMIVLAIVQLKSTNGKNA